jgi:hypothetical protein
VLKAQYRSAIAFWVRAAFVSLMGGKTCRWRRWDQGGAPPQALLFSYSSLFCMMFFLL